ncbi:MULTISPECIES: DUF2500 domain-containing protein [Paenibacillus]|uniref:DUF2500 domain-containing protein n=1 Tax=Paenibacillus albilobatus TaxID=2716884 RepID=A0A920C9L6_9BACL|nr:MULTISPECIES: DUF2500 domain-containing protein [Paenibacillus]MDR9854176.1 DUF2500 domain-containing protein [Paenibacillus sp. VCA1]GIO31240.1 hypothetical protein J2TS6_23810 [Paenibacillus albilobatus]
MPGESSFWMFDFFGKVMPIFFVAIIGIIAVSAGRGLLQWGRNNKQPVLTVDSRIVSKRTEVHQRHTHEPNDQMTSHTNTVYYITFEVDSGDRMEFPVSGKEFGLCAEGDSGRLTFQGTRYKGFERRMRFAGEAEAGARYRNYERL